MALWEPVREVAYTSATETTALQEQLAGKSTELLQLLEKSAELSDELSSVRLQSAAGNTVSDDLSSVVGACERPGKRTVGTRLCNGSSATPPKPAFLAHLGKQNEFKN